MSATLAQTISYRGGQIDPHIVNISTSYGIGTWSILIDFQFLLSVQSWQTCYRFIKEWTSVCKPIQPPSHLASHTLLLFLPCSAPLSCRHVTQQRSERHLSCWRLMRSLIMSEFRFLTSKQILLSLHESALAAFINEQVSVLIPAILAL